MVAREGRAYLDGIAERDGELLRFPYGWPIEGWADAREYGWAHGVSGTVRLYQRLAEIDADASAGRVVTEVGETLLASGLPGELRPPLTAPPTTYDLRFGHAGALLVLTELAGTKGGDRYAAPRDELVAFLMSEARRDQAGAYWEIAPPPFMGAAERARYTGYLHGAAGIGLALLRVHARLRAREPYVVLPDDPFAWTLASAKR